MEGSVGRALAVVAASAALLAGAALAANSDSFGDPTGDAGGAPDVTGLTISNDDAGTVTIKVSVANRSSLATDDEVSVGIDADQNPDSGGVFYGADFELTLLGAAPALLLPGADGYYHEAPRPASLQASSADGIVTFSFKASELGLVSSGFQIYALGFVAGEVDTAPDIRTFNYQLIRGASPPPLKADRRAPLDEALKATGVHGKVVRLEYFVADGRAETSDTIRVLRRGRVIKRIVTRLEDTNPFISYQVRWRVPKTVRGKLRFCVSSVDRAGNRGKASCAPLTIR
jgi:hypothetical protein